MTYILNITPLEVKNLLNKYISVKIKDFNQLRRSKFKFPNNTLCGNVKKEFCIYSLAIMSINCVC